MQTTETGTIREIINGKAAVLLDNTESCVQCGGCGNKADNGKDMIVHVPLNPEDETVNNIHPGDHITLECETGNPAKMGFLYLMLPLILALTGYTVGRYLVQQAGVDAYQAFGGVIAGVLFIVPYVLFFLIRKRREKKGRYWIRITGRVDRGECV